MHTPATPLQPSRSLTPRPRPVDARAHVIAKPRADRTPRLARVPMRATPTVEPPSWRRSAIRALCASTMLLGFALLTNELTAWVPQWFDDTTRFVDGVLADLAQLVTNPAWTRSL